MLLDKVDLCEWTKCSEGSQREVYEHPAHPDILIKVVKSSQRGDRGCRKPKNRLYAYKARKRFGAYMTYKREVEEYLEQARKLNGDEAFSLPIPKIFGFVHTDMGLGLVVERIADRSGAIAPTLAALIRAGRLTKNHFDLVDAFFEQCRRAHIVLMDVNTSNFVITDRNGVEEIICVDGVGEKLFLRPYSTSRWLNAIKVGFDRRKLLKKIERYTLYVRPIGSAVALPSAGAMVSRPSFADKADALGSSPLSA